MKSMLMPTAVAISIAGCCHPVPIIAESIPCAPLANALPNCAAPVAIKDGATYSELLKSVQLDRINLQRCAVDYASLVDRAKICQDGIAKHNAEIRKINEASKK